MVCCMCTESAAGGRGRLGEGVNQPLHVLKFTTFPVIVELLFAMLGIVAFRRTRRLRIYFVAIVPHFSPPTLTPLPCC